MDPEEGDKVPERLRRRRKRATPPATYQDAQKEVAPFEEASTQRVATDRYRIALQYKQEVTTLPDVRA